MGLLQGTTMRIKKGTDTLFHETNATLDSTLDFKEVASKDTGGKIQTPGSHSWNITCDKLIANDAGAAEADGLELFQDHLAKTLVTIEFSTSVSGDIVFSGQAYVSQCNISSTNDEEVTGSFTFLGSGDLTVGTVA